MKRAGGAVDAVVGVLDIVSEPPPVRVTVPLSWMSVSLPPEFMARVPLLVIVPAERGGRAVLDGGGAAGADGHTGERAVADCSWTPPLELVSVPPLIVVPLRFTVGCRCRSRGSCRGLLTVRRQVERAAGGGLERAGVGHGGGG